MDLTKSADYKELAAFLIDLTKSKDTSGIVMTQKSTLHQYEETNEMLRHFLNLSDVTYKKLSESYAIHIKTLNCLQKDLELTFKKIRVLKGKLMESYPEAFKATADAIRELELRYEMEDEQKFRSNMNLDPRKCKTIEAKQDIIRGGKYKVNHVLDSGDPSALDIGVNNLMLSNEPDNAEMRVLRDFLNREDSAPYSNNLLEDAILKDQSKCASEMSDSNQHFSSINELNINPLQGNESLISLEMT